MAQRVQVQLIDDLTGDDAQETVRFALDGTQIRNRPNKRERRQATLSLIQVRREWQESQRQAYGSGAAEACTSWPVQS